MRTTKTFLVTLIMVLYHVSAMAGVKSVADTIYVSGHLTSNTDWRSYLKVVYVTGDLTVDNGVTLEIGAGVPVKFTGNYFLKVEGRLIARGTEDYPILFTIDDSTGFSGNDTTGGWRGIRFDGTAASNDSSVLEYCIVEYGKAFSGDTNWDNMGGGIFIKDFDLVRVKNCMVRNNKAESYGGGIRIHNADVRLINTKIMNNYSKDNGGGLYVYRSDRLQITNCLIAENTARGNGGGMVANYGNFNIINSSFVNNRAEKTGDFSYLEGTSTDLQFINCIIWGTDSNLLYLSSDNQDPSFKYCDIRGGKDAFLGPGAGDNYSGIYEHNISAEPDFTNSESEPYSLKNTSSCANSGTPDTTGLHLPQYDLAGNNRIYNSIIDIGCYELQENVVVDSTVITASDTIRTDTVWDADTVKVIGDVTVADSVTLRINPGVYVEFQGHYQLNIQGTLLAEGSPNDSIIFTINDTTMHANIDTTAGGWRGIRFERTPNTNDPSVLSYCIIEYGKAIDRGYYEHKFGGALFSRDFNHLTISNSTIRHNVAQSYAGGLFIDGTTTIINSKIINNKSHGSAGGCYISYTAEVINCLIAGNEARTAGGGAYLKRFPVSFVNVTIADNKAGKLAGGLFCNSTDISLYNSILAGNESEDGAQVHLEKTESSPDFYYCSISGDTTAFSFRDSARFAGAYENCIDADTLFVGAEGKDYYMLAPSSPCVNAGTPDTSGLNLPAHDLAGNPRIYGSAVDIGCYESNVATALEKEGQGITTYQLKQNFPNPFNPQTRIDFYLQHGAETELSVYNVLGQKVATLIKGKKPAGAHSVIFYANELPSGVYFYKLSANNKAIQTRKMILLR